MMGIWVRFDIYYSGQGRAARLARCCVLLLLACNPLASAKDKDWNYRIRTSGTIWDLVGEYLKSCIPWQRLQAHNRISNPSQPAACCGSC